MSTPFTEAGGRFGRVSLVDIDRPVAAHAHPQCHALFWVGGANSVFEVDGRRHPLAEGAAVLVNAWQPHSYPLPAGTQVLALYIEPAWLARLDTAFGAAARRDFFPSASVAVPPAIASQVYGLAEELRGARTDPRCALAALECLMIELIARFSCYRGLPRCASNAPAVTDRRLRKALAILAEDAAAAYDIGRIARESALSRAHLFELLKAELGITPAAYRNVVRMEHAYHALLKTENAIGDIAKRLGFAAHAHFTRFFRDNHGISPHDYRRAAWYVEA